MLGITTTALANLARQGQITRHRTAGGHGRYTRQEVERVRDERAPKPRGDEDLKLIDDVVRLYDEGWPIRRVAAETHRPTPLIAADEIVVLDRGKVAQRGPHNELVVRAEPYRDLWEAERLRSGYCSPVVKTW